MRLNAGKSVEKTVVLKFITHTSPENISQTQSFQKVQTC